MWGMTSTTKGGNLSLNKGKQDAESHIYANRTVMKHRRKISWPVSQIWLLHLSGSGEKQENNRGETQVRVSVMIRNIFLTPIGHYPTDNSQVRMELH
jgi:hypothetical protein